MIALFRFGVICLALLMVSPNVTLADEASALQAVKTDGPTVKDAMWSDLGWMYVGVLDDGTRRDGLASYFCAVLSEHGIEGRPVKIIDIVAVTQNRGFRELGRSICR